MKKLLIIFAFLITGVAIGQVSKVKAVEHKGVTTAVRDGLNTTGVFPVIYNTTTGQFERWNGVAWEAWGAGGGAGTDDQTATEVPVSPAVNSNTDVQSVLEDHETRIDGLAAGGADGVVTNIELSGTTLVVDGTGGGEDVDVDLSSLQDGTGTDDQNISGSGLAGTNLTIGIENGTNEVVDLSSLQDGTGTDDQTASEVAVTDSGANYTATDVEGILAEIAPQLGGGGTDDQTASEVNITDSGGNYTATTVEAALAEIFDETTKVDAASPISTISFALADTQGELTGLGANTIGFSKDGGTTLTASGIANVPSGNLVATDVQAALNELQTELDGAGGGGASQLSDLSDVNTSTTTNRNVLVADGVDFESRPLVEADISDLSHTANTDAQDLTLTGNTLAVTGDPNTDVDISTATAVAANTAKTSNATHTGDVTGATALTIAAGAVDIAMLSATGTADATTYLRGDNTWGTPAGGGGSAATDITYSNTSSGLTATNVQTAIDEIEGRTDVLEGLTNSTLDSIPSYANVADLPAIVGGEVEKYAYVYSDSLDWNDNGLYAIVDGSWVQLYHYLDYYRLPILYQQRNEINLDSPWITDGYTFNSSGDSIVNASKYLTNPIPVRPGEWIRKTDPDPYILLDVDLNLIATTDPAYDGGNSATDDIKIPITADNVVYLRWVSDIAQKNSADYVVRQMFVQSTADDTGWMDYHYYRRDNTRFSYDAEGVIWKNYNTNLFRMERADYTRQVQNTGTVWTGGLMSNYINGKEGQIFSSNVPSQQVAFYDEDFTYTSGQLGGNSFAIPTGSYYFTVGFASATDASGIIITNDRITYEDITPVNTTVISEDTPSTLRICLIGDSMSSETEAYATETALGSLSIRPLKMYGADNISSSGESYATYEQDINSGSSDTPFADVYVLFLGTNDAYFASNNAATLATDIATVITNLKAINADANFYFITPPPREDDHIAGAGGLDLATTSDIIIKYAVTNGYEYLDFFRETGLNPDWPEFRTEWFVSADGLHPSNEGQAAFLYPEIAKMFKLILQNEK